MMFSSFEASGQGHSDLSTPNVMLTVLPFIPLLAVQYWFLKRPLKTGSLPLIACQHIKTGNF